MTTLRTLHGRHYRTGVPISVTVDDDRIVSVEQSSECLEKTWIAPAFFDLQINGCDGRSFNSETLTVDDVAHIVKVCRRHGIGGLLPTLVTHSREALLHGFRTLRSACEQEANIARAVPGFHLEGPYISSEDGPRGAHPKAHVRPCDIEEFKELQDTANGRIRLVTLAPETQGAISFIEQLTATGVVVAIGHTAASGSQIEDAIRAGARLSTHLGNGCAATLPRHDNPIWPQLAADELWMSIISDGHHLPPAVVKSLLRAKSPARTIVTCDASSLAGLPPGRYRQWDQELEVQPTGRVVVPGTSYLAGSGLFTDTCISRLLQMTALSLGDAIEMATAHPRELLGLPQMKWEPGSNVELMVFDWVPGGDIHIKRCQEPFDIGMSKGS
jgi:N-acetylglucosamine-6-phosphate deacetylase